MPTAPSHANVSMTNIGTSEPLRSRKRFGLKQKVMVNKIAAEKILTTAPCEKMLAITKAKMAKD